MIETINKLITIVLPSQIVLGTLLSSCDHWGSDTRHCCWFFFPFFRVVCLYLVSISWNSPTKWEEFSCFQNFEIYVCSSKQSIWFGFACLGTLHGRILRYELFCMVLLSLNNMLIKFVQVVACRFSFYLLLLHNNPAICIMLQCINPFDFGPFGCLYVYRPFRNFLLWSVYSGVLPSFFFFIVLSVFSYWYFGVYFVFWV